jgi:hypothetical protein
VENESYIGHRARLLERVLKAHLRKRFAVEFGNPRPADTADQVDSDRCRDRADEGEPDILLEVGKIEPGDADGDREGGPA